MTGKPKRPETYKRDLLISALVFPVAVALVFGAFVLLASWS